MAEQQKKPAEQKKRPRFSENAEGSGAKKSSSVLGVTCCPAATVAPAAPSPAATSTRTRTLAAPSPIIKTKPAAVVKPASTVTVTTPVVLVATAPTPPTQVLPVPSHLATTPPSSMATTPPSSMATTPSLVVPSQLATTSTPALKAPNLKATGQQMSVAEPGVLEQGGGAMAAVAAMAAQEKTVLNLDLKKNSKWVQCAACSSALKPPVFMCENKHAVCSACLNGDDGENRHCGVCGRDVAFTHLPCMDGLVGALEAPCPYKKFGCGMSIAYHAVEEHKARCAHAPCYCLECTPPFEGSPASLVRHLTDQSGGHRWPKDDIKYGTEKWFVKRVSSLESNHRHLLVAEDGGVFLLAVDPSRPPAGRLPVTVVCVSGNARPAYRGTLTVQGPWDEDEDYVSSEDGHKDTFKLNAKMASCAVPGEVDMEQGRLNAHVNRELLHGDESLKVHLSIRITKLP